MAVLVVAALLVSCASEVEHPIPNGPSFKNEEVRFVAPTGWEILRSTSLSLGFSEIRVYLASQPLRPECGLQVCQSPLGNELRQGGMLVTWLTDSCVATLCDLPAGTLISIGNRQGVRVPTIDGCEETGFTERYAYYVTVTPQRVDILFTCSRDPSDGTRSAFLGFLDAIHWRIP